MSVRGFASVSHANRYLRLFHECASATLCGSSDDCRVVTVRCTAGATVGIRLRRRAATPRLSCVAGVIHYLVLTSCALLPWRQPRSSQASGDGGSARAGRGLGLSAWERCSAATRHLQAHRVNVSKIAQSVEAAITGKFGFACPVVVLTAMTLPSHPGEPASAAVDPSSTWSRSSQARPAGQGQASSLRSWTPEARAVDSGQRVWCANGIIESSSTGLRSPPGVATTRNWATILKLQAAAGRSRNVADPSLNTDLGGSAPVSRRAGQLGSLSSAESNREAAMAKSSPWSDLRANWAVLSYTQRFEGIVASAHPRHRPHHRRRALQIGLWSRDRLVVGALDPLDGVWRDLDVAHCAGVQSHASVRGQARTEHYSTKVVLLIALLAIARKLIVFGLRDVDASSIAALAAVTRWPLVYLLADART